MGSVILVIAGLRLLWILTLRVRSSVFISYSRQITEFSIVNLCFVVSWGEWTDIKWCPSGLLTAFQLRVESSQGVDDDTGANNIRWVCGRHLLWDMLNVYTFISSLLTYLQMTALMSESFIQLIHSETSQVTVFMNGLLNHWLTRFIQKHDSISNKTPLCVTRRLNSSAVALKNYFHQRMWAKTVNIVLQTVKNFYADDK